MRTSVCSYSFHRSFEAGEMDIDGYVDFCGRLGFTELDAWSRHLGGAHDDAREADRLRDRAEEAGVPFGSIAVDGADAWAPTEEERAENRERTERWLETAARLGAKQARFNAGPFHLGFEPGDGTDEMFEGVVGGFADLVARGRAHGVEVLTENHWGPFQHPSDLGRLLDAVPGLGFLFDTHNWPDGLLQEAWDRYAHRARLTHMKTFGGDDADLPRVVSILRESGYDGTWGVESVPPDGDERAAAARTLERLRGLVEAA